MKFDTISRTFTFLGLLGALAVPSFASAQVAPSVESCSLPMPVGDPSAPAGRQLFERAGIELSASDDFAGQAHIARLQLQAGRHYVIETFGLSAGADTVIALRRADDSGRVSANDAVVAENDDRPEGGLASATQWDADRTGTYYVHVRAYDESSGGTFNLRVTELERAAVGHPTQPTSTHPTSTHPTSTHLTSIQPTSALSDRALSFRANASYDTLPNIELMELTEGSTYAIETYDLSEGADTVVEVRRLGASGAPSEADVVVAANDDADGYASRLVWSVDENGPYYLHIRPYAEAVGTFGLRISQLL